MKYKSVAPRSLPTPCMFRMYKYIYSPSAIFRSRAHAYMKLAIASQRLTMSTAHTLRALHWRRRGACTPGSIYSSTASGRSPHGHRLESKAFFVWSPHGHRTVTARSPLGNQSVFSVAINEHVYAFNSFIRANAKTLCFPNGDRAVTVR